MIKFKPIKDEAYDDPVLKKAADDNGWIELPADVMFQQDDFSLAVIKINDVIYRGGSREFWDEYKKEKTWGILLL